MYKYKKSALTNSSKTINFESHATNSGDLLPKTSSLLPLKLIIYEM